MRIATFLQRAGAARWPAALAVIAVMLSLAQAPASGATAPRVGPYRGLTVTQRATLLGIARDTWKFYAADVDPGTHLPLDNLTYAGGSAAPTAYGRYTSAANIGVYLWAVVAAADLGLVSRPRARELAEATLTEVQRLKRFDGFLYQWYDTTTGDVIRNPGDIDCSAEPAPTFDNCRRRPRSRTARRLTPTSPGRDSGRWAARGRPTRTRNPASSSPSGKGITPTQAPA